MRPMKLRSWLRISGNILKINKVAAKWFRLNMDDILETNLYQIVPEDYAAVLKERTAEAIQDRYSGIL